jgi:uncharacterized protein YbjT (DUF2867 family)
MTHVPEKTSYNSQSGLPIKVVMLGATGAVGQQIVEKLRINPSIEKLTLLGKGSLPDVTSPGTTQHLVDISDPITYQHLLPGHQAAVCTLGVDQPSTVSEAELIRVDKLAVIGFATACRQAGITHFELLGAVAADAEASSLYLRTKGELRDALVALGFPRLSIFEPSMILTPTNRYGFSQGLLLLVWPKLNPLLRGSWSKYRGIAVGTLGAAIAANLFTSGSGVEQLHWRDFIALTTSSKFVT